MKNNIWHNSRKEFIERPKEIDNFLKEVKNICKKYNLSISHEDRQGSFIIEKYDSFYTSWLNVASLGNIE